MIIGWSIYMLIFYVAYNSAN